MLKDIELFEISLVESPADNNAHVSSIKSATKLKDVESILRQKGFSQKEATEIVATVKKIHGEREEEKAVEKEVEQSTKYTQIIKNFNKETFNV